MRLASSISPRGKFVGTMNVELTRVTRSQFPDEVSFTIQSLRGPQKVEVTLNYEEVRELIARLTALLPVQEEEVNG